MIRSLPPLVVVPTVATAALLPIGGLLSAGMGARHAGVARPGRLAVGVMAALAGWGAIVVWFAHDGILWGKADRLTALWLFLAWLLPMATVVWGMRHLPRVRAALSSRSGAARLASTQVARNLGLVFLVLHSHHQLPGLFAYPAAWGDVVAGVTAPLATWACWFRYEEIKHRGSRWRGALIGWNVFGLGEHVVVVVLGALLFPGTLHLIHRSATTAVFASLPMVLFPGYLVCFADSVHLLLLDSLARPAKPEPAPAAPAAALALAGSGA